MFPKMGDGSVNQTDTNQLNSPLPMFQRRLISLGIDVPLVLVTIVLIVFGLMMVYSASTDFSLRFYGSPNQIFNRQLIVLLISLVAAVIAALIDYHIFQKIALAAMVGTIILLIAVQFISDERHGAVRTLLSGSVQPSELAKLVIVIYLSVWLYNKRDFLDNINFGLIPLSLILGIVGALIIIQPDVSAVFTICIIGGTMFFLAGGDLRQIAWMMIMALFFGFVVVVFSDTASGRLAGFLPGLFDPLKAPYHVRRSLEAFYHGGWFGVGLGNSIAKNTGLPVPHTDSIFAVVGEELGIFGTTILVSLYIFMLWRGLSIARQAKDQLGSLLAAGLSIWLVMEAFINMLVMINLLPFAGNALPFISAGGSNLFVSLTALGILINISRVSGIHKEGNEQNIATVINMRWRDRRRRLSRSRRAINFSKQ